MFNKKDEQNKKYPYINNTGFYAVIISMLFIIISSICLEILAKIICWFDYTKNLFNTIGVCCQVISAVVCSIISFLGISISLQNNDCYGIKIKKLYAMRAEKYFSIRLSSIIAFSLLCLNIVLYLCGRFIICFGVSLSTVVFCMYYLFTEIPYMIINESTIQKIIKNRFIKKLDNNDILVTDFFSVLAYQLKRKNIKVAYELFSDDRFPLYNKDVLLTLLEVLRIMSESIDTVVDEKECREIIQSLNGSVVDILWWAFDISQVLGDDFKECKHHIIYICYKLLKNNKSKKYIAESLAELITYYEKKDKDLNNKDYFTESIVICLLSETIKNNDLYLLETIRNRYSLIYLMLSRGSLPTTMFTIISMYLYYLAECEIDTPKNIKKDVKDFIFIEGTIENTKVISWAKMFQKSIREYAVNYNDFINIFNDNIYQMDFMLKSGFMHLVVLDQDFANNWFLTCLFASNKIFDYDYERNFINSNNYYLEKIKESCYTDDVFAPNDIMVKIVEFFGGNKTLFSAFINWESHSNRFKKYLEKLKKAELKNDIEQASKVSNEDIEKKYYSQIVNEIKSEWAYNDSIDIRNEPRKYLNIVCERNSKALNYDDAMANALLNSVFYEISDYVEKECSVIINNNKIYEELDSALQKDIQYFTSSTEFISYSISNETTKKKYNSKLSKAIKVSSRILSRPTLILRDGFSFRCEIEDYSVKYLEGEILNDEVDKYKRSDGQYVYKSLFMTREEVALALHKEYAILHMGIRYKVDTYPGAIIQIDIY